MGATESVFVLEPSNTGSLSRNMIAEDYITELSRKPLTNSGKLLRFLELGEQGKIENLLRTKLSNIDLNKLNSDGDAPLHMAARRGQLPVCKMLVGCGANQNTLNSERKTALEVARDSKNVFCEAYLSALQYRRQSVSRSSSGCSTASTIDRTHSHTASDSGPTRAASAPSRGSKIKTWATSWVSRGRNDPTNDIPGRKGKKGKVDESADRDDDIPAVALYTYNAQPGTPFPPDCRKEFSLSQGDIIMVEEIDHNGWAIVRVKGTRREGYVPGNFLSLDGKNSMVDERGNPYCPVCKNHKKAGHKHTQFGHSSRDIYHMNSIMRLRTT